MFQFSQATVNLALSALSVLSAFGINVAHKLAGKVKAETLKIKNEDQRTLLQNAVQDVEDLTTKTVTQIEQTTAKTLRAAVKDGKADKSALEVLAKQAYIEIADALTPECKDLIEKYYGQFSSYLTKTIEEKVFEIKNAGAGS